MFRWLALLLSRFAVKQTVAQEMREYERKACLFVLTLICFLSFGLMLHAAWTDAAIMDELAHIPAGYGYVSQLDYRLNPEHPPLVKALAELPVLFLHPNFPTNHSSWTTDLNGQWEMGRQFLYNAGNDADMIIRVSRIGPILLTILLVILIYLWARELLGARWALLPAFLFALSPTVLAHGHYVTTDIAASFGFVVGTYGFVHYLMHPSRRTLLYAGLAFGLAQVAKFSTILLIPIFMVLVFIDLGVVFLRLRSRQGQSERRKLFAIASKKKILGLIAVGLIGYILVVYPVYFLFTLREPIDRQVKDTTTILIDFGKLQKPLPVVHCTPGRCLANLDIWMSSNYITRPFGEYFLGILMVLTRSSGGNTGYFFGELSRDGWLAYFPALYVLKETLPVLIMILIALIYSVWGIVRAIRRRNSHVLDYLETSFPEFAMMTIVVVYWTYSMKSPLNIGLRHLLPTFPFIYILTASALKRWVTSFTMPDVRSPLKMVGAWIRSLLASSIKRSFMFLLILWFFIEALVASPHFLSYYNELGGGTQEGYRYVTDSNYDWGQDMLRLQAFVAQHPEIDKIGVDYFGGGMPNYYLGSKEVNWWSAHGNPTSEDIHWLAVSVNTLESARAKLVGTQERNKDDEYQWLVDVRPPAPGLGSVPPPDFRVGTSIFVYHL